ncbi:MAG: glycosyltransferase family 39 protein [Hyphomicrobium sp.]|uniref:ArnT family glycosyltransferase n=1 Tax=Hyphomicrobium sp. TaxID=82 RepID=UPI00356B073F
MRDLPDASPAIAAAEISRVDRADTILIAAALALFALRLVMAAATGLVDDEAYYRLWSLAPSLSYYDHPPMIAWLIGIGRVLIGDTTLGVRLVAPLCHLLGAVLLWRTAFLLYGRETARTAVWILLAMPLLAIGGLLMTPDLPSVLFAGLVLWALAELDHSKNANWWLAIGAFAGLGLLSKYTNLFLGATIVLWLVAMPENRRWFRVPQLWIGGLVAIAASIPVVIWNAEHDWASFGKQFGRVGHSGTLAGPLYFVEFIGTLLALASPVIAVLAILGLIQVLRSAIRHRRSNDILLAAAVLPMLIYFAVHALHDRVQGNWPAPLYPPLAICAALAIHAITPERRRTAICAAALGFGFLVTAIIYFDALRSIPAAARMKDPTEQMHGWHALGDEVEKKRIESGAAWVATSSYATTGQLAFALNGQSDVAQLDQRIRYEFLPPISSEVLHKPVLYVELDRRVDLPLLKSKFRTVTELGTLTRSNGSANGATYRLFLASDPIAPPL